MLQQPGLRELQVLFLCDKDNRVHSSLRPACIDLTRLRRTQMVVSMEVFGSQSQDINITLEGDLLLLAMLQYCLSVRSFVKLSLIKVKSWGAYPVCS